MAIFVDDITWSLVWKTTKTLERGAFFSTKKPARDNQVALIEPLHYFMGRTQNRPTMDWALNLTMTVCDKSFFLAKNQEKKQLSA